MGFFSSLMGQELLGTAIIKFYGENKASVEYETEVSDKRQKESDLIQLFALYYAKMLYNLNRGEHADQLIIYVRKAIKSVMAKKGIIRANVLASKQKLVEPKEDGITKKYSGELYEKSNQTRIIQTHIDIGGEEYYTPISTIMFLQYLINNLPEELLIFLVLVLGGMNKYYQESGDYSNMRSIIEAPNYGFDFATRILNSDK